MVEITPQMQSQILVAQASRVFCCAACRGRFAASLRISLPAVVQIHRPEELTMRRLVAVMALGGRCRDARE